MTFGGMEADMQPQGHVQLVINLVNFSMNIQNAIEAPRIRHLEEMEFILEEPLNNQVSGELERGASNPPEEVPNQPIRGRAMDCRRSGQ